ncbi:MAG: RES family NAD+ phosphorylase [Bacteroidales bacterium]|jgi:hypothetical protein
MRCCPECFRDNEVKALFRGIKTTNDCDYCGRKAMPTLETVELEETFKPLLNIYEVNKTSAILLSEKIQLDWNIFNLTDDIIQKFFKDIFPHATIGTPDILVRGVINKGELSGSSSLLLSQWNSFKDEIKNHNRFFVKNSIDFDFIEEIIIDLAHEYHAGKTQFFRGRISTNKGWDMKDLNKPPADKSSAGRANPVGIPYLYVSLDEETTLYETRATYLDFVTIGTFELVEDIKIVRFRSIHEMSPFVMNNLEKYSEYQGFLVQLEKELSEPLRRYDSELDYLPTQYLCEFVKSQGYDGVEYGSAMNKGGINLAIFNDNKLKCVSKKVIEIKNIIIDYC